MRLFFSLSPSQKRSLLKASVHKKSQLGQDVFALLVSDFVRDGFFVEFGASDGVNLSNTYILEKYYGWRGILSEPGKAWHGNLYQNRNCIIDTHCVWSSTGSILDFTETSVGELSTISIFASSDSHFTRRDPVNLYSVESISLFDLLVKNTSPQKIDFLSIDTEGSEFEILMNFRFDKYKFSLIVCEHNYTSNGPKIDALLSDNGYCKVNPQISLWDSWYLSVETKEKLGKKLKYLLDLDQK